MSTGGDWRFILEDLGTVAGLFDVTGHSDYPRSVVNFGTDRGCEDVRTLVESARDEALMERRRKPSSLFQ